MPRRAQTEKSERVIDGQVHTRGDQGGSHTGPEAPVAGPILHTFGLGWLFFLTVNGVKTYRT